MNVDQQKISDLLSPLAAKEGRRLEPATPKQLAIFNSRATEQNVPQVVVQQLMDLYTVANEFEEEIMLGFSSCDDLILFEWWENQELWLGLRHFHVVRWADEKFCMGDASNVSFSAAHAHTTLLGLLASCVREIEEIEQAAADEEAAAS